MNVYCYTVTDNLSREKKSIVHRVSEGRDVAAKAFTIRQ